MSGSAKSTSSSSSSRGGVPSSSSPVQQPSSTIPSSQVVASALSNSPTAASKISDIVSPDRIVGGNQAGSLVLGSFDDSSRFDGGGGLGPL